MGYCRQISLPLVEPVSLAQARQFLRLPSGFTAEDTLISGFIAGAREKGEILTGRALAQRKFTQVLDSHPYYTDAIQGQQAYPASYYSLPRYSTTLWNYSQMIKLGYSPAISVEQMRSINPDGTVKVMMQDADFILDRISEPARIFPLPGSYWPADLYVANALEIDFTAGYDPDPTKVDVHSPSVSGGQQPVSQMVTGVPQLIVLSILNLMSYWFNNRGQAGSVPEEIEKAFLGQAIVDWSPTRG
jgi:hypothetical protein